MDTKTKLKSYLRKIEEATNLNKSFGELVGIELFDYIQDNPDLRLELEKRVYYYENLSKDREFEKIQDELFKAINKILKNFTLEDVQGVQKRWNNATACYLKNERESRDPFYTLPELYKLFQHKENYYLLGDNAPTHMDDNLHGPRILSVQQQYKNFELLLNLMRSIDRFQAGAAAENLQKQIKTYNDIWYKFDEKINKTPIKLHVKSFHEFFYFSASVSLKEGHEFHYQFFNPSLYEPRGHYKFEKVKPACITIIEDLLESLSSPSSTRTAIYISSEGVVFIDNDHKYEPKKDSARLHFIKRLLEKEELGSEEIQDLWDTSSLKTKEIKKINELIGKNVLNKTSFIDKEEFITYSPTSGTYHFNTNKYEVIEKTLH